MIENHRTGRVWERFMRNPEILDGMRRAGFQGGVLGVPGPVAARATIELLPPKPNPFRDRTRLAFRLASAARVQLRIYDVTGREVARPIDGERSAGLHEVEFRANGLSSGLYYCRLQAGVERAGRWITLML
jgi:hypothetical protein